MTEEEEVETARIKTRLVNVTVQIVRRGGGGSGGGSGLHDEQEEEDVMVVVAESRKSLLASMLVRQLRSIVMRMAKVRLNDFEMYATSSDGEQWVRLDSDARPLSFYGDISI
ncbi:hypothetical protein GGF42_008337, partial [Coemansia sp. RSA 2424]